MGFVCPKCKKPLKVTRGIEVGNIFQLGTKYSAPMNACYTDENGKNEIYLSLNKDENKANVKTFFPSFIEYLNYENTKPY